eukprot:sb/3478117/
MWSELKVTKQKKYRKEAQKEGLSLEMSDGNRKLVEKLLRSAESRKRKREGSEKGSDSQSSSSGGPSGKKERGDNGGGGGIVQDFFCMDCFTLGKCVPDRYELV